MGFSEETHDARVTAALTLARREKLLRQRGFPISHAPTAGAGSFAIAAGAATAFLFFRQYEAQLRKVDWTQLPVLKQFHALLSGETQGRAVHSSSAARLKPRPVPSPATVSGSGKPKTAAKGSATATPAAAAGTAAQQRAGQSPAEHNTTGVLLGSADQEHDPFPEVSTSTSAAQAGQKKKKKSKKK
ncbi:hypothetical protein QJQ45_025215 [Haematococcus lacustris]|nr:hypothetical protein QJQ45_025215 [Haematococcus lacustris]